MTAHLVIGASGQIGEHILLHARAAGHEAHGTYFEHARPGFAHLDIRDSNQVESLVAKLHPNVVWLPAAIANVDYCEGHSDETFATNVKGLYHVLEAARRADARLVYFSSDYIFDGREGPYSENDVPRPLSEYGCQKLIAEHAVAVHAPDGLILRTTVVYGWESGEKNFVLQLLRKLRRGERMRVPSDQVGTPTYVSDLAKAAVALAETPAHGVFHLAGTDRVDRLTFAKSAARAFGLDPDLVEGVTTDELDQGAPRPLEAGLISHRDRSGCPTLRGYAEGLRAMAAEEGRS